MFSRKQVKKFEYNESDFVYVKLQKMLCFKFLDLNVWCFEETKKFKVVQYSISFHDIKIGLNLD